MKYSTTILFIILIVFVPLSSIIIPDSDSSKILNSKLVADPFNANVEGDDKSFANLFSNFDNYVEDQIILHEEIFKFKYQLDYITGKKNTTPYYYIPELNISYQYDKYDVQTRPNLLPIDQVCKENEVDFMLYVAPSKRNSIPDKYIKEDYLQYPKEERQKLIEDKLAEFECVSTVFNPDVLLLNDYYPYEHHYNSKGVYKIYVDLINEYNNLYNTNIEVVDLNELEEITVSNTNYVNPLFVDDVEDFTTEFIVEGKDSGRNTSPYDRISYPREGEFTNESGTDDVLIITDSYGQAMNSYLTENFHYIKSLNFYDIASDANIIDKELSDHDYDRVIVYIYDINLLIGSY